MKVVIFGGSGFIGSELAIAMRDFGHRVSIYSRNGVSLEGVESVRGCISDLTRVSSVMKGADIVYNLVNGGVPASSNCLNQVQFDLVGNINILESMRDMEVERMVYVSSGGAVYGDPDRCPIVEEHPLRPKSGYGVVKATAEMYCRLYSEQYGLKISTVRPANAYGPGQDLGKPQGVVAHFIKSTILGEAIQVWGDGTASKDYIFISDLVSFLTKLLHAVDSGVYNVGSGVEVSVNDLIELLGRISGRTPLVEYRDEVPGDVKRYCLDIGKAKKCFGWEPLVGIEQGVMFQYESALSTEKLVFSA